MGKSNHVFVSVSIDFPSNIKQDVLFHPIAYDYSCADYSCVGTDVYIPHRNYQVEPHSSQLLVLQKIIKFIFFLYQQNESSESKVKIRHAGDRCKRVLQVVKLVYVNRTNQSISSQKLGSRDFGRITNSATNRGKSHILPLFTGPKVLSSTSDKAKLFSKNFFKNSNLDDLGISLSVFPSRTNLKLHNISNSRDG